MTLPAMICSSATNGDVGGGACGVAGPPAVEEELVERGGVRRLPAQDLPAATDVLGFGDVAVEGVLVWGHGASLTSRRAAGAGVARRTAPGVACAIFHWHDADHA